MVYPLGPDTIQMQYESKKFADCLLNNQHTITVPITIKVPALNATMSRKYCMACAVVYTCIYTATQSLLITLLIRSCDTAGSQGPWNRRIKCMESADSAVQKQL